MVESVLGIAILGSTLVSCRSTPPAMMGQIVTQISDDWGSIGLSKGQCAVVNNTWNRAAAGRGFEQSVFVEDVGRAQMVGWKWQAPWHFLPRVVSQPQIVRGNKPWGPKTRPDDGFPFAVGEKDITADFDVHLRANGIYNMAFSLWGVSAIPPSRNDITHEIMIWTMSSGQSPAGQRVDSITVSGVSYDVYLEPNHKDASGQNQNSWTYVAFVPSQPVLRGPVEISAFLEYLLRRGTLSRHHYVTSLEFGNEVSQGKGIVEIRGFTVRVQ